MPFVYFEEQIKHFFGFQPTFEQENAIKSLARFIFSSEDGQLFLLKGFAGTGKTSVVSALVRALVAFKQPVVLLAPTGRAAKVFSQYSSHPAYTIHRRIYRQKTAADIFSGFILNYNKYKNAIFIVDEASMISDSGRDDNNFGSGSLLGDLMSFVYDGEHCKLILVGDEAQLPPVGFETSPALDARSLLRFGTRVHGCTLKSVVRQESDSGILSLATSVRGLIENGAFFEFPKFDIRGFRDVHIVPGNELIESLCSSYSHQGVDETMVITRSNKRAIVYNGGIRARILDREEELCQGDRIMVSRNNYFWTSEIKGVDFIANGDTAIVRRVRNRRSLYGFDFADVELEFPDLDNLELSATVLLSTLSSESPSLSAQEQNRLYEEVMADYADLSLKKDRLASLRKDIYYNALQIKYAYALTCHKGQGGQWMDVYLDQGYVTEEMLSADYFRWLYTAMTRATTNLYLVNWPKEQTIGLEDE